MRTKIKRISSIFMIVLLTGIFSPLLVETPKDNSNENRVAAENSNNAVGMNWPSSLGSLGTSNLGNPPFPIISTFTTVMSSNTTSWDATAIATPFVLFDSQAGLYKMWYWAMSNPVYLPPYYVYRHVIAYAESRDGVTWTNKTIVHDTGSGTYYITGAPWILKENGTYLMWHMDWYEWVAADWSKYIARMSSSDGVNWPTFQSLGDQKVLSAQGQSNPQGDGRSVSEPWIIHTPGQGYAMWYSVYDYPGTGTVGPQKIWTATSVDGVSWSNRQLSLPYVPGSWEANVAHPSVLKERDGTYTMYYAAAFANGSSSIGVARSPDGISWTDRTQLLKPSDLSANITYIGEPSCFQDLDGKRYLYFTYSDGQTKFGRVQLADWWPMFHHDLTHKGYSTSKAPNTNQTVWVHRTSSYALTSSPAVADGVVYVGSTDNNTYALNATWGTQVWNYTTDGPVNWASPAVAGGVVYVGSGDGNVYALNATTGTRVWNYTTDSAIFSSPAVVGGVVYEGSTDGKVYALNATTGAKVWSYTTDSEVWSSPAVAGGVVYVGSDDGNVYALNATTGAKVWNYTTDDWVDSSPAVDYGMVFVGSYDNNIYALNASTGAFIWSYTTDSYVVSSPAVAGGVVYVGSGDGNVYALNATTGTRVWNYTTGNSVESSPAVAGGVVYVGSMDRYVYALNATTGVLVWSYLTYGWVFSSPAVVGGVVYVGSYDRRIYAFGKQVGIYPQDPKEPAPMGIADYGISPAGPYEYATKSFVGIVTIKSLSTNSSFNDPLVPDTKMGFQLNVNLAFNTSYAQYVYWIQNTMGVDTSTNRVTFGNNVWNSSAFGANMSASGISGNGQVDLSAPRSFYYCGVNQSAILSLPGNNITLTYPITITFNVTSGVDSSGKPTVSFAYDDGYGLITYDTVTFTNVTGLTSLSGFEVNGFIYKPSGSFYNSELILGGPSDGYNTRALQSDVRLQLEYWNGHNYEVVPNAYNFGRNTAEGIDNVLSEFSYYPENGRMIARIQPGAGQLGELYDQSQTGVFNITSPLTSGTLCVTNASDPNATAWQIPFVSGEVTVTLYPGYYDLQLYDQYGELFDQGNFTVSAGQILYLQAPFSRAATHNIAANSAVSAKTAVGKGFSDNVTVLVADRGDYAETFNVTAYANSTVIGTQQVSLNATNRATLTFTWNTTGFAYGNYTLSAYAWPVPGETDTVDNNFTGGWVVVSLIGDITGPDGWPDGKVDMRDIGLVAKNFGETVPPANPNCDLTGPTPGVPDGKIDMRDIGLVAKHFGEHYP